MQNNALKKSLSMLLLLSALMHFTTHALAQETLPNIQHLRELPSPKLKHEAIEKELHKSLLKSVFRLEVEAKKPHELAQSAAQFDGAAVAIDTAMATALKAPKNKPKVIEEVTVKVYRGGDKENTKHNFLSPNEGEESKNRSKRYDAAHSSFFGKGLEKSTSPFEKHTIRAKVNTQDEAMPKQYYLSTADWLSTAQNIWLIMDKEKVSAQIEYRDEQRNIALLSTAAQKNIQNRQLLAREQQLPQIAYVLLNPQSSNEIVITAELNLSNPQRYGRSSLLARHGYALFDIEGHLLALVVGPDTNQNGSQIVHHRLIWDALSQETLAPSKE